MISPGLIRESVPLLAAILDEGRPADQLLAAHCRARPALGSRERGFLGELLHDLLRQRRLLDPSLAARPERLLATALAHFQQWPEDRIVATLGCSPLAVAPALHPAVAHSLPDWLWSALEASWGRNEATDLAAALNRPAPVDLRVNLAVTTREAVLEQLRQAGIAAEPIALAPAGLRLERRQPLGGLEAFRCGHLEIQDAGSQSIAPLLEPRPGETLVDLCAGGGGKSLHLAALMGDRGRIIATDTDPKRLAGLRPRLRRAGLRSVSLLSIRHEGDPKLRSLAGQAHGVLVDAPCSGTGTLRRHPDLKWRLEPHQIDTLHLRQSALLAAGARLVRPGGRLLYATCSLLARENQAVVEAFLRENPRFILRPLAPLPGDAAPATPYRMLTPHRHGTDGFFAALLQRRG
ncbi:MAG: RsmB/NOP family class I SAM-dependent RNA methyltransferase [Magnetococcales bacterium]|nr:RsmB/NOP family class I SAM-dependent RNA methyltransferase [Magnetococcales bacterium]